MFNLNRRILSTLMVPGFEEGAMIGLIREASKKAGGSTKNHGNASRPKHRGIRVQDGRFVQKGTLLVVQNHLRFHPGLNVGFGRNGTLYAMVPGVVRVSCESPNLNMNHTWVSRTYGGRETDQLSKKYFNVIPHKQHNRFKVIDTI